MELSKRDNKMAQGLAIISMVTLHLFCVRENLPYTPIIEWGGVPLAYWFGLFAEITVPIYLFCSGYAQALLWDLKQKNYSKDRWKKLLKFVINFWIALVFISLLGVVFDENNVVPGSITRFIGNLTLVGNLYTGIWWFVRAYIILIVLAPLFIKCVNKFNSIIILLISGIMYVVAFTRSIFWDYNLSNEIIFWIFVQLINLGTTQFMFMVGMVFYKRSIISKLRSISIKHKNTILLLLVIATFIVTAIIENGIIAPIVAAITLCCFHMWNKPEWLCKGLEFLGNHSTNIWFVHPFFYASVFVGLVYRAKYALLVELFMFVICIASSYIINAVYLSIKKRLFTE